MIPPCVNAPRGGKLRAGAEHTLISEASGRHDSAALSCPYSVRFRAGRVARPRGARHDFTRVFNPCQPTRQPLNTVPCGSSMLVKEPETMTTSTPGSIGAHARAYIPRHYLRRLALSLTRKAAKRRAADRLNRGGAA